MKKIACVLLFLAACSSGKELPEGVLPEQRMVEILIELQIAEAKISNYQADPGVQLALFQDFEARILQEAGVDSTTYKNSYSYYLKDLERLNNIYTAVKDTLEKRRMNAEQGVN